ncbi:MAG TPA: YciI family protein [Polyangiaceae bacterium]|nr:YciI family protein [Polyangiaceae bacterium]
MVGDIAHDASYSRNPMFVIELSYTAPLTEIDAAMKDHVAFLEQGYAAGLFLISGRKLPRDGGIILALGPDRAQIEALMQHDPFVARGLASVRVIEFRASQRADDIDARLKLEPTGPTHTKRAR